MYLLAILIASCLTCGKHQPAEETRLLYIRHGEVPGNDPSPSTYSYTGSRTDQSLTEKGQQQARQCAEKVAKLQAAGLIDRVAAIYSSTLKRAIETAQPIGQELGLEVETRSNLREIDWGAADGQLVQKMAEEWGGLEKQVKQQHPDRKIKWDYLPVYPKAETYNALLKRSVEELSAIGKDHPGETVLIVGHGRVLKTLIADAIDSEENVPHLGNGSVVEFRYSHDRGLEFVKVMEE